MSTTALSPSSSAAPKFAPVVGYADHSLEIILQNLCHVGVPTLHKMTNGWWVKVEMHVAAAGTTFTVKSESDCPTPIAAARQCAERVVTTLQDWAV